MGLLAELQAMTKAQLIAKLLEGQTEEKVTTEYYKNGEQKRQVRQVCDVASGKLLSTREATWTYYKAGPVDTITLTEGGKVKTIKHFTDGRQPSSSI